MTGQSLGAWIALALAVSANVGANLALRESAKASRGLTGGDRGLFEILWAVLTNPMLLIGGGLAGVLLVAYWYALRGIPVVIAYPLVTGLAMAGIAIGSWLVFGEQLEPRAYAGIGLIMLGATLLASGGQGVG